MKQSPATPGPQTLPDPSLRDADGVVQVVGGDLEHGLTSQDAIRRLAQDGANELRSAPVRPGWRRALAQFEDSAVYLLLAALVIALVVLGIEGRIGWPVDAIVTSLVVLLNGVLGYVQEARAENAVAALTRMTAVSSAALRDGKEQRVPSAQLVRGDVLALGEGDAVGADARRGLDFAIVSSFKLWTTLNRLCASSPASAP